MKFTIDTLIGAAVLVVVMSIFLTPVPAMSVIYYSVVCTAGISLVIWIPLATGIGRMARYIFSRGDETLKPSMPSVSANRRRAIETYVANAVFKGMSLDKVASQLDALGWSRQEVDQVIGPDEPAR
jgi:hypothetical protein